VITYFDLLDADDTAVRFHGTGAADRKLTGAPGLPGVLGAAGARDATYPRPAYHGAVTRTRWQKPGLVTLEGYVRGDTPDLAIAQYDAIVAPLFDALDTARLAKWQRGTDGTGVELQAYARLASEDIDVKEEAAGRLLRYQAHLRLDDPRGFTQAETTAIGGTLASAGGDTFPDIFPDLFAQGSGASAAVNNTGTRPTPPVFRVYGLCVDPQILLIDHDVRIALTGTVSNGNYLEIDVKERTIRLNGTSPAQGYINSASTTWFELPRGTSTVQLLATSNDTAARCDAIYRSAFA